MAHLNTCVDSAGLLRVGGLSVYPQGGTSRARCVSFDGVNYCVPGQVCFPKRTASVDPIE